MLKFKLAHILYVITGHPILAILFVVFVFEGCVSLNYPKSFVPDISSVDYSNKANWAALPGKIDSSDMVPSSIGTAEIPYDVDVFFIYPTSFTNSDERWNAPIDDIEINEKTDKSSVKFQASIFNRVGKVYCPRYRQANLKAYFTKDKESAKKALDLAYSDVKSAFEYYLKNYNHGRAFIIATHSQGTTHGKRLIKELIDGKEIEKSLIAAYLVGIPVMKNEFMHIKPCQTPGETGCFCSWRTFKDSYETNKPNEKEAVINPISWTTSQEFVDKDQHKGSIMVDFNTLKPHVQTAQIHDGVLLTNKPKFKGSVFYFGRNFHIGDYNLFYRDVQENARLRTNNYLNQNK